MKPRPTSSPWRPTKFATCAWFAPKKRPPKCDQGKQSGSSTKNGSGSGARGTSGQADFLAAGQAETWRSSGPDQVLRGHAGKSLHGAPSCQVKKALALPLLLSLEAHKAWHSNFEPHVFPTKKPPEREIDALNAKQSRSSTKQGANGQADLHAAGQKLCKRSCGLMDKALVFGTKDCRLESCQDHMRSCSSCSAGSLHHLQQQAMTWQALCCDGQLRRCSGITSALHAEGPGLNPHCVHAQKD